MSRHSWANQNLVRLRALSLLGLLAVAIAFLGCDDSARALLGKEGATIDSERLTLEQALGTQHDFYRLTIAQDGRSAIEPTFTIEAWVFLTEDDLNTCPRIDVPEAPWIELAFRCFHNPSAEEDDSSPGLFSKEPPKRIWNDARPYVALRDPEGRGPLAPRAALQTDLPEWRRKKGSEPVEAWIDQRDHRLAQALPGVETLDDLAPQPAAQINLSAIAERIPEAESSSRWTQPASANERLRSDSSFAQKQVGASSLPLGQWVHIAHVWNAALTTPSEDVKSSSLGSRTWWIEGQEAKTQLRATHLDWTWAHCQGWARNISNLSTAPCERIGHPLPSDRARIRLVGYARTEEDIRKTMGAEGRFAPLGQTEQEQELARLEDALREEIELELRPASKNLELALEQSRRSFEPKQPKGLRAWGWVLGTLLAITASLLLAVRILRGRSPDSRS